MGIVVVGAGLAGCEVAWQAAERGIDVRLYEMRPRRSSPAHITDDFAELVCSNSLRAAGTTNAVGVLKQEMRRLNVQVWVERRPLHNFEKRQWWLGQRSFVVPLPAEKDRKIGTDKVF